MIDEKKYLNPKLDIVTFTNSDIITVSVDEDGADWGKGNEEDYDG